jgi:ADP-dependent NAD(P)H-hydrate dehydratase
MSEEIISVTREHIQELLPARLVYSKKGDNGIVLVVGGSGIYHGAPLLSTLAALRSGVDLVYTAVPKSNVSSIRSFCPDVIVLPLPSDKFTIGSAKRLLKILPKNPHVAVIGMGMVIERQQALVYLINQLKSMGTKLLLDASSLVPDILPHITGTSTIVTPHPGEFKRLFQKENSVVNSGATVEDQESNVYKLSRKYGITIILKGYNTIVCDGVSRCNNHQKQRRAVIRRTTPAMTVGGCGDVLSGVVAGLLTKMQDAFAASIAGVYLSGIAGSLAYQRVGLHMVATDLIEELPNAMKPFDKINSKT